MRASFDFDANRCTGCQACQLACVIENELEYEASWRQIHTFNERRVPDIPLFHLSLACNHCAQPACLNACPALAYTRDAVTGAVLIDGDRCIGCRYCGWACPYDAPRVDDARGVMTKCTFCNDRLHAGREPACVDLCPTGALRFSHLSAEALTQEIAGFARTDLGPAIRIVPPRAGMPEPVVAHESRPPIPADLERHTTRPRVSLRSEWSLAAFTFLGAASFGLQAAAPERPAPAYAVTFLAVAVAAMALATLHLGRKARAWRAILGIGRSWLSREIVFFSLFVGAATLRLTLPGGRALGVAATVLGLAALVSMDRVYRFRSRPRGPWPHSAGAALTGLLLWGILSGNAALAGTVGSVKLVLYLTRKLAFARAGDPARPAVTLLRVGAGFAAPAALWGAGHATAAGVVLIAASLLGELIDRLEFYAEFDFPSPAAQMAGDLTRSIRERARGTPRP